MKTIKQIFDENEPRLKDLYNDLDKISATIKFIEEKLSKYPASEFKYVLPDGSTLMYREKRLCLLERISIAFTPLIEKPSLTRLRVAPHLSIFLEGYLNSVFENVNQLNNKKETNEHKKL